MDNGEISFDEINEFPELAPPPEQTKRTTMVKHPPKNVLEKK